MARVFVAIDIPDQARKVVASIMSRAEGVRWVPEPQLHVTLRFIGAYPEAELPRLIGALREVCWAPFEVQLRGVGRFPPRRAAHVLWAGLEPGASLVRLADAVSTAVASVGVAPEPRAFAPHLTLARIKGASAEFVEHFLTANAKLESEPFWVRELVLFESVLSSAGAKHTPIARFSAIGG